MSGDLWDFVDNGRKPNRAERRAQEKRVDRSLRVGLFGRGGKHHKKTLRTKVKGS